MKIKHVNSPFEKLIGLIGKKNIRDGIYFKTSLGIHTLFMREPIDVLLLDEKSTIVRIKKNVAPWKIWVWGLQEYTVVELPSGYIRKQQLKTRQNFSFE